MRFALISVCAELSFNDLTDALQGALNLRMRGAVLSQCLGTLRL